MSHYKVHGLYPPGIEGLSRVPCPTFTHYGSGHASSAQSTVLISLPPRSNVYSICSTHACTTFHRYFCRAVSDVVGVICCAQSSAASLSSAARSLASRLRPRSFLRAVAHSCGNSEARTHFFFARSAPLMGPSLERWNCAAYREPPVDTRSIEMMGPVPRCCRDADALVHDLRPSRRRQRLLCVWVWQHHCVDKAGGWRGVGVTGGV